MNPKASSKRRLEIDGLSSLPDDIIEYIFSKLPVKDVVRTSILSRNWRNKWTMLPCLVLDGRELMTFSHDKPWNYRFVQLRLVKITGVVGSKPELDLIEFTLLASTVLEEMSVYPDMNFTDRVQRRVIARELLWFRRASRLARVHYYF